MSTVIFFEKPGCKGNARQKALLAAAGHTVDARNLKTEAWSVERLRPFLARLPVAEWFNRTAPAVASGQIVPEQFGPEEALALFVSNPLLVRRPLLQVGEETRCGFDAAEIEAWIGLNGVPVPEGIGQCQHGPADGHTSAPPGACEDAD